MSPSTSAGWSRRPRAACVTAFLESFFERYVEYDFTASLEEKLDEISAGKLAWKDVLRDFWKDFSGAVDDIKELRVTDVLDALNEELAPLVFPAREDGSNPRICPKCGTGKLSLKLGKFGAFVGCSNYPECSYTRQLGDAPTAMARRRRPKTARRCSARIPTRPRRSRCAPAASAPMSSAATARKPSAPACRRAGRRQRSTTRRRWRCCRCRATSASIPKPAR